MPDADIEELEAGAEEGPFDVAFERLGKAFKIFSERAANIETSIGEIELELENLDDKIDSKKHSLRKRMRSALDMSDDLRYLCRKVCAD